MELNPQELCPENLSACPLMSQSLELRLPLGRYRSLAAVTLIQDSSIQTKSMTQKFVGFL